MHNTPEQVHQYLEQALVIVKAFELTDDLRVKAFELAVNLVAGKQIVFEQIAPGAIDLGAMRQG